MKKFYNWFKNNSTHKCATVFIYIGAVVFVIIALIGWFQGKENAVGMMNCAAMVIIANSAQYATKSTIEHSKGIFSNPIVTGAISGLMSGDPSSGVSNAISTIQMAQQMGTDQPNEDNNDIVYNDPSIAPPPENMPTDEDSNQN